MIHRKSFAALVAVALGAFAVPALSAEIADNTARPDIYSPKITVNKQRMTQDQLISEDVMLKLASDTRLRGKIGVETDNRSVKLTGLVGTPGQALRAERDVRLAAADVREVRNYLRTKVG